MPTPAEIAKRKGAAIAEINSNSAALATLSGLPALTLHPKLQNDDPQTVELLELLARLTAAVAALAP